MVGLKAAVDEVARLQCSPLRLTLTRYD